MAVARKLAECPEALATEPGPTQEQSPHLGPPLCEPLLSVGNVILLRVGKEMESLHPNSLSGGEEGDDLSCPLER